MNWEAISAVGQVLSALAVVATLVYLSVQVRQNNRLIQRDAHLDRIRHVADPLIGSPEQLANVLEKVNTKDGCVEPVTQAFMEKYDLSFEEAMTILRYLHRLWFGYEADFLFTDRTEHLDRMIPAMMSFENNRLFWQYEKRWLFSPEFIAYVDSTSEKGKLSEVGSGDGS